MTQSAVPTPVLPLQYDNTRPDTLVRVVRLFCYSQLVATIFALVRVGLQAANLGGVRTGYPVGPVLSVAQVLGYSVGPFVSNALLLATCLLGLQFAPAALTCARLYCVVAWAVQGLYLVAVPLAMWSYYASRGTAVPHPTVAAMIGTNVISALAGFVFPTVLHVAIRVPALRDLFRSSSVSRA